MRLRNTGTHAVRTRRKPVLMRRVVTDGALLLLPMLAMGCHPWKVQPLNAGQASQWSSPIRVTLASGELLTFDAARTMTSASLFSRA